ncbi:MAG: glycosyltransferase family 4 protein [Lachnospiraceae bacterium]|nr:glycosyltransferase family 4 protein [Lachnospiraceae bacterium]
MKKILYVASAAKNHICHFHIPYLKWFKEHGYTVHVAAGDDFEDGDERTVPYSDRFFVLPISRSPFRLGNIKTYRFLKKLIEENDYELICCNTPVGAAIGRLAARKKRKQSDTKVVYISHGFHFYEGGPKVYKLYYLAEKLLVPYTDAMITINAEDYKVAKRICRGKKCKTYYVHGMGVDTKKYAAPDRSKEETRKEIGIPQEAKVLISVSEINKNKNLATTIKALSKIKDRDLYYVICGVGEELQNDKALAKQLGVEDRVLFLGYRKDINDLLNAADIFLFPSIREGLGMAPIEAMSAGLPVIASDIRGVHEYAVDRYNSILLDPMDIKGFVKAIRLLCDNEALRKKLGENAKKSVKKFDIENSMNTLTTIFKHYAG